MRLNVFEWWIKDYTKPVNYERGGNQNPRLVYRLEVREESTNHWLWYIKLRYAILVTKYQTRNVWVSQYLGKLDTAPKETEKKKKVAAARANLTKALNKLHEAEKVAAGMLDFGENDMLLDRQRMKVERLAKELKELENDTENN